MANFTECYTRIAGQLPDDIRERLDAEVEQARKTGAAQGKKAAQKAALRKIADELVKEQSEIRDHIIKHSKTNLTGEGLDQEEIIKSVVDEINKEIGEAPAAQYKQLAGSGVPKTGMDLEEAESKFLAAEPEIVQRLTSSGQLREFAGNVNLSRIENADELADVYGRTVSAYSEQMEKARRGYRTNKQTQIAADAMGMTPEQLLKRRRGQALNAEEALAARHMLASSADNLTRLAKKINQVDATDLDKFEFRRALNLHYAIQAQVQGMTAEAGRALQAFNISARSDDIRVRQIGEMIQDIPGVKTEDIAHAIGTMDNLGQIGKFTSQVQRAKTKDMFLEAWINGLLSGPTTHAVNSLSNALVAVWQVPERLLASGISRMTGRAIAGRESVEYAFGLVEGMKEGLKLAGRAIIRGEPSDPLSKIETQKYHAISAANVRELPAVKKLAPGALKEGGIAARAVDVLGEAVRMPGRFLMAEDEFFKTIGYRMELNAQAFRMARDEGLAGEEMARRITEIKSDPEVLAPSVHAASVDASRYSTFTKPLESELGRALSSTNHPALRIIIPFVRTPANILKFAFARTPMAPFMKSVRDDIIAGGARRDIALARASLGSMVMAVLGTAAAAGHITGGGPSDHRLRSHKYNQGWQPYSFKIGDTYYAYGRLEPLGMLFGLAADSVEVWGELSENQRDDLATNIIGAISRNVLSKTWLRGLSEAVQAFEDPTRYGDRWLQKLTGTVVPTLAAQIERALSPELEAVYSYLDAIKQRIPGYSDTLPVRRNIWGEPIVLEGGLGPDIVSPIYTSKKRESPVDKELLRLKAPVSMPSKSIEFQGTGTHLRLEPEEYDRFITLMNEPKYMGGPDLKTELENLIKSPEYKRMTDERKRQRIRAVFSDAELYAKEKILNEYPILKDLVEEARRLRREAMTGMP